MADKLYDDQQLSHRFRFAINSKSETLKTIRPGRSHATGLFSLGQGATNDAAETPD